MSILKTMYSFFKLTVEEKDIDKNEIGKDNTRNAYYLSLIAIPVSIIHIVLFALKLNMVAGVERQWVYSIIFTHASLLFASSVSGLILYFSYIRSKSFRSLSRICTNIMLLFMLVLGALLATFDQYVTPAITPFLNTTLLMALFFQVRPSISLVYYAISYLLFIIGISLTQVNQEILISNQVNGLSITVLGLCLSMVLWRSKLTRINQRSQITKQNKALSESNAEKDKFFSIIAHDLRSPFNSILGFSDLLIDQVKEKNMEGIDEYANIIKQSSQSAMDLLMNLMEWSKAHTGRMEFNPENVDLNELIKESESLLMSALLQKKIQLRLDLPAKAMVFVDKNMIRTIVRNLLFNAIKFTYPGGCIQLRITENEQECVVAISDDGVGIPEESMQKIFRMDQNYSTYGTQKEKGTGLGLILCKELIDIHKGRIWAESEQGKGSTFYFSLPLIGEYRG